ncbi:Abi-alpha family protein [Mucilaginibacter sp. UYCu711]|uniref:Abi-alpha family protein n=1 Tax=Mucilaginibacter sp. UYCu711 TaxID=3156339 RepID=UPI003D1BCAFB
MMDDLTTKIVEEGAKEGIKAVIDVGKSLIEAALLPPAKEFGKLLSDQVSYFRFLNRVQFWGKVQVLLQNHPESSKLLIAPRVASRILDNASEVSNDTLQNMWAGLFAASCGEYQEDENIFFIDLLKSLTSSQVKLLSYLCKHSKKTCNISDLDLAEADGVVYAKAVGITYLTLCSIMETDSRLKVDTELEALEIAGLVLPARNEQTNISLSLAVKAPTGTEMRPSLKTLRLYVKCQGSSQTPFYYFVNDLNNYYYEIIKDFISVEPSNALTYIYEKCLIGVTYKDDVEFGNGLTLKNEEWANLSTEELTNKLRSYIIYRHLDSIGKTFNLEMNQFLKVPNGLLKTYRATFSYKDGVKKIATN